jgi:hypothetical protein
LCWSLLLGVSFWRLFSAAWSAAVGFSLIDVLETLGNARLLVSFTLSGSARGRCGLSYGRNN